MISRSARYRLATLTSWALAALVVAIAVIGFVVVTRPSTLQAVGIRLAPPTPTVAVVLLPTPTPEPPGVDASGWVERAVEIETTRESERLARRNSIQAVVDFAAADIESWSTGAIASIAVVVFDDADLPFSDRVIGVEPNLVAPSASLAKAYWVTAAAIETLDESGTPDERRFANVEERAGSIFRWSSNEASTALIATVGVDKINDYTAGLGMTETFLTQWASGQRAAEPNPSGSGNTTSTSDAVRFLDTMYRVRSTNPEDPVASPVLEWMLEAPDDMATGSYGGVFTDRLPDQVSPFIAHKAGWLPPACCESEGNTLNAMGLVDLATLTDGDLVPPDATSYALAVSVTNGRSYDEHAAFIAWTSCLVYQTLVDPGHGCGEPQDVDQDEPA